MLRRVLPANEMNLVLLLLDHHKLVLLVPFPVLVRSDINAPPGIDVEEIDIIVKHSTWKIRPSKADNKSVVAERPAGLAPGAPVYCSLGLGRHRACNANRFNC